MTSRVQVVWQQATLLQLHALTQRNTQAHPQAHTHTHIHMHTHPHTRTHSHTPALLSFQANYFEEMIYIFSRRKFLFWKSDHFHVQGQQPFSRINTKVKKETIKFCLISISLKKNSCCDFFENNFETNQKKVLFLSLQTRKLARKFRPTMAIFNILIHSQ